MAFILTPQFAPVYHAPQCSPFGFCAPVSRPTYPYRVSRPQPRQPAYSPFNQFFSQVGELLGEIDRKAQRQAQVAAHAQAQREAYRQRQQRKRALRAKFDISQNEQGWQVDGDIQGFNQENISIEVTDDHTLKIAGNTEWQSEKAQPKSQLPETDATAQVNGATLALFEGETATKNETTASTDSDTESHKSYQATVEDDFEDLGAETSSLVSVSSASSAVAEPTEPKGKEKVVEEAAAAHTAITQQPQQREQPQEQERIHGSFERTFRFPERIDAANVSASFKDGGLKVTIPKAQVPRTRRIAIL